MHSRVAALTSQAGVGAPSSMSRMCSSGRETFWVVLPKPNSNSFNAIGFLLITNQMKSFFYYNTIFMLISSLKKRNENGFKVSPWGVLCVWMKALLE